MIDKEILSISDIIKFEKNYYSVSSYGIFQLKLTVEKRSRHEMSSENRRKLIEFISIALKRINSKALRPFETR